MPPSAKPVNVSRRFVWLGGAVLVVCLLYSAAWFVAAWKATDYLKTLLAAPGPGMSADCAQMDIRGFPFRAGVFCASAHFENASQGLNLSTGAVRTMTLVYNPTKAVFEVDGPVKASFPGGTKVDTTWGNFDGSIGASLSGLTRASVFIDRMENTIALPSGLGEAKLTSDHAEIHARQNGPDLDIAARTDNARLTTALLPTNLPVFSSSLEATLDGRAGVLEGEGIEPGEDVLGTLNRYALDFGTRGFLAISGPFKLSGDGVLSGDFTIEVQDFAALQTSLSASFPQATPVFDTAAILLKSLSKDGRTGRIEVNIREGHVFLGIIPLGVIPRL